jgi:rRNA maturation RNase YbeY
LSIQIFYGETSIRYRGWRKLKEILKRVITEENKVPGDLNVIITNDDNLRSINIQFLEHDYFTDVITFNYNSGDLVNGEVYISADTVKINALNYNVSFNDELSRVIIHGTLHLTGYNDKTGEEKALMRSMEDKWLSRLGE